MLHCCVGWLLYFLMWLPYGRRNHKCILNYLIAFLYIQICFLALSCTACTTFKPSTITGLDRWTIQVDGLMDLLKLFINMLLGMNSYSVD